MRKNVFQYDDVLNFQRHFIYEVRKDLLCNNISNELITRLGEAFSDELLSINSEKIENWYDYYANYRFMEKGKTKQEKMSKEFETIGYYLSDHPLNQYKNVLNEYNIS